MIVFRTTVILVIVAIVGAFAVIRLAEKNAETGTARPLAQCLTQRGVTMYGAYWCPHCAQQKKLFGKAFSDVTYIECAQPGNPQTQTQVCQDAQIKSYPTWVFPDGTRQSGEMSLEALAEKSGCPWGDAPDAEALDAEAPTVDGAAGTIPAGTGADAGAAE